MSATTLTSVPTGTWNVDPSHSSVEFQVKHMAIATVKGQFNEFQGSLTIADDGTATASGAVEVASVDTRESQRDEHLKSPDFFDAANHPQITFVSTEITPVDEDSFKVTGDITIHGVTKSITLAASVEGADEDPWGNQRVALSVTGQINRGDFGMTFNQALGSGNMLVADKVKIAIDVSAVKA
ncbi:YceI family protein [Conexibacter woesei]|uniref:YceI family protein n=1 Tax=Conexibacter woesei (strain DSM 14684 / CCUG 47730 / CIP 108061 / JCM 11494 / NBRC 100937 / ID131577) TaxID=469383 RepID=D3FBT7_CONWI|nr:YceI family protein [Conexibacter woesei]ADB51352.1 YceI family protein [Conexibacter woesei DSM 14684]